MINQTVAHLHSEGEKIDKSWFLMAWQTAAERVLLHWPQRVHPGDDPLEKEIEPTYYVPKRG